MKCLVIKLSSPIDNDELECFNKILIKGEGVSSLNAAIIAAGCTIEYNGKTYKGTLPVNEFMLNTPYNITIENKYNLTHFDCRLPFNCINLKGCEKLTDLYIPEATGDIKNFVGDNKMLQYLTIHNVSASGSIDSLSNNIELLHISLWFGDGVLTGDISSLIRCTKINIITIQGSSVEGNLEDFVKGQIMNGRENCTEGIKMPWLQSSKIKYKGTTPPAASDTTLTWNKISDNTYNVSFGGEDTTITL